MTGTILNAIWLAINTPEACALAAACAAAWLVVIFGPEVGKWFDKRRAKP